MKCTCPIAQYCPIFKRDITPRDHQRCQGLLPKTIEYQELWLKIACPHRGTVIEERKCDGCGGSVLIKIFSCILHGQCTINPSFLGVEACSNHKCQSSE